jgi:hypothetical protein
MRKIRPAIALILTLLFAGQVFAQQDLVTAGKKKELDSISLQQKAAYLINHQKALNLARTYNWPVRTIKANGGVISLQGTNSLGFPVFLTTHNLTSAQTTNTVTVQPGGELGLSLSGSSGFLDNKLAIWDVGSVYIAHQEFAGKTITLKDNTTVMDHSTHVAGTMIAKGVYPEAIGMAFGAATLISYDFDGDIGKMSAAAGGLLLSNHSYGDEAGWDLDAGKWTWYGLPGDTADYSFGFYGSRAQSWDEIAAKAPYYLIVESAGNNRATNGPSVGTDYYGYTSRTDPTIIDKGPRPGNISSNSGYRTIPTTGNAKNTLTVGAVGALPNGPASGAINVAEFSSIGPTNDGRVKPDIMGMGVSVLSTVSEGPQAYLTESGTSMSAPNVTGSLYLLQEYYAQQNSGSFMKAATLKGLACATAFDAGNAGPDYIYGWGLLDMKKAAQTITGNGITSMIKETTLPESQKQIFTVTASGTEPLMATISWTDPPGAASTDGTIDDPSIKLVNDLDIRVSDGTTIFMPWVLDPSHPAAPATTGDNIRDNVEQVYIASPQAGKTYTINVTNKGNLENGTQDYALIVTGINAVLNTPANLSNDINFSVYPVPASDLMNIAFNVNSARYMNLSLVNMSGETVYSDKHNISAGNYSVGVSVNNLPTGAYIVKMLLDGKLYSRKILVVK